MPLDPLPAEALFRPTDPSKLPFTTTADLPPPREPPGQKRAMDALRFGAAIRHPGYNVFALGPAGLGKRHSIRTVLEQRAATEPPGDDWCYVHDFADENRPKCLRLPCGHGRALAKDVEAFIDAVSTRLPSAFQSDDYRRRAKELEKAHEDRCEAELSKAREQIQKLGLTLITSPNGFVIAPTKDGKVIPPDAFEALPEAERRRFQELIEKAHGELETFAGKLPAFEHEHHDRLRSLNRALASSTVSRLAAALREPWEGLPEVLAYLKAIEQDVVDNAGVFLDGDDDEDADEKTPALPRHARDEPRRLPRYRVNVLVSREPGRGAPVVIEERGGLRHLVGRVDHRQLFGALTTDLTLIKKGALHEANGGYLLLDALDVLQHPYVWDELKRALKLGVVNIESVGELMGLSAASSIEPEPIPLDVKVVLLGDRRIYAALSALDPDFPELFKVAADFADELPRTSESDVKLARLLGQMARTDKLKALDASAVARVIEFAARFAGDAEKVTAHTRALADVLREADAWATTAGHDLVQAADVEKALAEQERRAARVREQVHEDIHRGLVLVATKGAVVGQVNGLAVVRTGSLDFGFPVRITARTRLGKGEVVDIEREATLGGPLHSKGVLIITGLLGARYTRDTPFTLSASVVFEQSYGPVEGDSASAAELFALLSSLAGVPLSQALAVTGSIDQHGRIQPIGGVNEKVEGFFDVCRQAGLSGEQGVIVPRANVKHLMLRRDVVQAVRDGRFRVWAIEHLDEGLELLTGQPAGAAGPDGAFPKDSVNGKVAARLAALSEQARSFAKDKTQERPPGDKP